MEKKIRSLLLYVWFLLIASQLIFHVDCNSLKSPQRWIPVNNSQALTSSHDLRIYTSHRHVVIDNGILRLTLTRPSGMVSEIKYHGIGNMLENSEKENSRGYWDTVSSRSNSVARFSKFETTQYELIGHDHNQIEVSFSRKWNPIGNDGNLALNIDKRYIVRRGLSGFYSYTIMEHLSRWPGITVGQVRLTFKPNRGIFHYMAISDDRQRTMPTNADREHGQQLDYHEAVLLTRPSNASLKGEVDDKFQYSINNKDNKVHGWVSFKPKVGFWMITPSQEFRSGGPMKQELTSHVGPTCLAVFHSDHYAGSKYSPQIQHGEHWKKVFGPVFIYLNSDPKGDVTLWEDANRQMVEETKKWPYDFPLSKDFPGPKQRGAVKGQLKIQDRYMSGDIMAAKKAYVGLAAPGDEGSWQFETKGYQFWTQTDDDGNFTITGVREGKYNLYAWVPGTLGEYKYESDVNVKPGSLTKLGKLVYNPPRNGPTLWEIGVPDRTAAEFFVPNAPHKFVNKLYVNHTEKFRQYGLWLRYAELYPKKDMIYTVGASDYKKDWFYAHVNRAVHGGYESTTRQIAFTLSNVMPLGNYTLQIALASANFAELQVRVNDRDTPMPHFTTTLLGRDNAIARHGIHGMYYKFSILIPGYQLVNGKNTIYLTQPRTMNQFVGLMYDYIRLEGPPGPN